MTNISALPISAPSDRRSASDDGPGVDTDAPPGAAPSGGTEQLDLTLANAEYLLNYAVEAGMELDPDITQRIISARRMGPTVWDSPDAGLLVAAVTRLAAKLHPVTAETLRACREDADDAILGYKKIVIWLAGFIIPLSMISFIYTAISNSITADLKTANDLAVTLHTQLDYSTQSTQDQIAPPGSLAELQQFAAAIRAVYSRTRQLNLFVLNTCWDPIEQGKDSSHPYRDMQLPADLGASVAALRDQVNQKTAIYQNVRLYANSAQDATAIVWGSISTCILPVLPRGWGLVRTFCERSPNKPRSARSRPPMQRPHASSSPGSAAELSACSATSPLDKACRSRHWDLRS